MLIRKKSGGISMIWLLKPHQKKVHTITSDNGKEFAGHEKIASKLKTNFYFAHPYTSWEYGTDENTNGLIRQYFPKNRDFTTITQQEINMAMGKLNNRPRKRLGYQTPNQVFSKSGVALHIWTRACCLQGIDILFALTKRVETDSKKYEK